MAINIKEILTTDSDLIRVDKTNYNFDQIVANGGGPIGIKGQKGEFGIAGSTGAKGEKGDTGAKGEIGPSGLDLNNWGRIEYDSITSTSILKPKKDDDDTEPTSIILGDVDYTTDVSDGIVNPNAWLNIVIPDSSTVYSNFISLLNGTTSKVNFSSSTVSDVDTYKITHDAVSSNDVNFEINIKNEVLINGADALNLTSGGIINIDSGNNNTIIGPIGSTSSANLDIRFDDTFFRGDLTVDSTGYIKVPVGTNAQRPTGVLGMIRYNSERNVGFDTFAPGSLEAFLPHENGNYWKPLGTLVDADGDTFISPDHNVSDGTENVLTISVGEDTGGGVYDKDFVGTFGETAVDGEVNLNRTFTYNNVIYAKDDILVDNDSGLRVRQNVFTPGGGQVNAQNNGAAADKRTLHDYYYHTSALQYNATTYSSNTPFATQDQIQASTSTYRYTNSAIKALAFVTAGGTTLPQKNVGIIFDNNTSKMSYIKVGHMVTVWGRLDYFPFTVDSANLESGDINFDGTDDMNATISTPARRAAFAIGRPEDFPYTSALTNQRVVFPISISLKAQDGVLDENTAAYFGVIEPGMNVFTIIEADDNTGFISGTKIESAGPHYAKHLNINDLSLTTTTPEEVITLEYSFSMPTNVNSYDLASNTLSTYAESALAVAEGGAGGVEGG